MSYADKMNFCDKWLYSRLPSKLFLQIIQQTLGTERDQDVIFHWYYYY